MFSVFLLFTMRYSFFTLPSVRLILILILIQKWNEDAEEEETGAYISYVRISDDEKASLYA